MARTSFGYVNTAVDPLSALEFGVHAEKCYFDIVWVPDHLADVDGDRVDPWTILAAISTQTRRIKLASSVTDTQRIHPAKTAQMVTCLDVISRGRAILGIGAGEAMNIVPFGLPWEAPSLRVERLAEAVQVIRALWLSARDKPVRFNGQFYKLENAFLTQMPKQRPTPPIYVGVFASKRGLEVAGRYGDGWHSWLNTPDLFRKRWTMVKQAAEAAGRSAQLHNTSHLMVAFPRNSEEKKNAMIAGKATLIMEKALLKSLGHAPETTDYQNLVTCSQEQVNIILHAAETVPDEIIYRTAAIGEIEDAKVRIEELRRAGVKHIAVLDLLAPRGVRRTLTLFRKIIRDYE